MTVITPEMIEAVLKHLTDRIALAILFLSLVCFLLMLGPWPLAFWLQAHWTWPFFGALGSACYLPTKHILKTVEDRGTNRKHEAKRKGLLENLAPDQKEILKPYILNRKTVNYYGWQNVATARYLVNIGILTDTGVKDGHGNPAFAMDSWIYSYLCADPKLVGIHPQNSN